MYHIAIILWWWWKWSTWAWGCRRRRWDLVCSFAGAKLGRLDALKSSSILSLWLTYPRDQLENSWCLLRRGVPSWSMVSDDASIESISWTLASSWSSNPSDDCVAMLIELLVLGFWYSLAVAAAKAFWYIGSAVNEGDDAKVRGARGCRLILSLSLSKAPLCLRAARKMSSRRRVRED